MLLSTILEIEIDVVVFKRNGSAYPNARIAFIACRITPTLIPLIRDVSEFNIEFALPFPSNITELS